MPGIFLPFLLDFEKNDNKKQAQLILDEINFLYLKGYKKIGITYSANSGQTATIHRCYQNNIWLTGTAGGNQADVMAEAELLLQTAKYRHLQGVFQILPITTLSYHGSLKGYIPHDLKHISQFIQQDNRAVLGWQNQHTKKI